MSLDKYTTKKQCLITKITWAMNHTGVIKEQN